MKTTITLMRNLLVILALGFSVKAAAQCQAGFTYTVSGGTVTFTNTSTSNFFPVFSWNFGDNTSANSYSTQGMTHTYATAGTYYVCLTLNDSLNQSCTSTFCDSVTVGVGCNNLAVNVSVSQASACSACDGGASAGVSGGTAPYNFAWSNSSSSPTQTNLCVGYYSVTVTDAVGCTVTGGDYVPCPDTCHADFTAWVSGNTVNVGNMSNDTASFVQFTWDFGDSYSVTATNPWSHTYATGGTYTITLVMVDSLDNCSDTISSPVTVGGPTSCGAAFSMQQDSFNVLQWYAYPSVTGQWPITYLWDFGDNTSSTQQYPTHTYATSGHYTICLTITDANNCSSTYCDSSSVMRTSSAGIQYFTVVPVTTGIAQQNTNGMRMVPNPANDQVLISFNEEIDGNLRITDLPGNVVMDQKVSGRNVKVDVSMLPAGCYNLTVTNGTDRWNEKIVVIH
ncbi:MAG TPA: PKD domain-containing protein [Bacteroidia bacterium]|nr:PKD domain-containing protein [Bacteroidia bacterium]